MRARDTCEATRFHTLIAQYARAIGVTRWQYYSSSASSPSPSSFDILFIIVIFRVLFMRWTLKNRDEQVKHLNSPVFRLKKKSLHADRRRQRRLRR